MFFVEARFALADAEVMEVETLAHPFVGAERAPGFRRAVVGMRIAHNDEGAVIEEVEQFGQALCPGGGVEVVAVGICYADRSLALRTQPVERTAAGSLDVTASHVEIAPFAVSHDCPRVVEVDEAKEQAVVFLARSGA